MRASSARLSSIAGRALRNYLVKRPLSVSFEVTHSCNARCKHCHLRGQVEETRASAEELGRICRTISPVVAQVSGGEPLLRHDLEEIIRALCVSDRAPATVVTTNGALLSRDRYASLRQAGLDELSLSLDYPDERHDEFRGIPRLFGKISDLMTWLKSTPESGVTLGCVVQSDNYRLLPDLAALATRWGVMLNFSSYTRLRTRDDSYMLKGEQIDEFEEIAKRLVAHRREHKNIRTSPYGFRKMAEWFRTGHMAGCQAGYRFFNVNPDGTFSPCGLVLRDYKTREELQEKFSKTNSCEACFTSIRQNSEKPLRYLLLDNLGAA